MPARLHDLTGKRFGRLTVVERAPVKGKTYWRCECSCGHKTTVRASLLVNGRSRSCGCYRAERVKQPRRGSPKHGHTVHGQPSPTYLAWANMVQRCTNPNRAQWKDYGGRGITVCRRWLQSFAAFLEDMGERPVGRPREYSIERIDNSRGYEPGNCRWATRGEQSRNTRRNIRVEVDGVVKVRKDWCLARGIDPDTVRSRVLQGETEQQALARPARKMRPRPRRPHA